MRYTHRQGIHIAVDTEPLIPIASNGNKQRYVNNVRGRPADLLAAIVAGIACLLSCLTAALFFWGFAETDRFLPGLTSAFLFSLVLGAFAVIPSAIICRMAYKGWKLGLTFKQAVWAAVLILPWTILSILVLIQTPLPFYIGAFASLLSGLLLFWAIASAVLTRKHSR